MITAADLQTEEVRVALAMNGGVSLAVWMGGCVVELDCARRAHLGTEDIEGAPAREVYHLLCRAFRRELVFDVMSGASAGGINGALLAAATVHRRRLHPDFMRERWLDLGDFSKLLHRRSNSSPASLMQGESFRTQLEQAFEDVIGAEPDARNRPPDPQPDARAVKLDITTTDVIGQERKFRDVWREELAAREFRARFRFRETDDYVPSKLAVAARSTASFPVAFEPSSVDTDTGELAGFNSRRWAIDGGLLDNAPIRAVLDLIPTQPASRQVRRYLCYLNPDPSDAPARRFAESGPSLAHVLGSVVNLPRTVVFVDQVRAVERASRAAHPGREAQLELLSMDRDALLATADALFGAYVSRRGLLSLEEILLQPMVAAEVHDRVGKDVALPWIPSTRARPAGRWEWGVRPAQRVLHLALDLLRIALGRTPVTERAPLLAARVEIDTALAGLDGVRGRLLGDREIVAALLAIGERTDPGPDWLRTTAALDAEILMHLEAGFAALVTARGALEAQFGALLCDHLFGAGGADFDHFLERALAMEVVRRAFSIDGDIESSQTISFAQLTPMVGSPLFATPGQTNRWVTAEEKLTGIRLGHFAAFYRRSWRANDYLWGRLDAAVRVVDLLVDGARATELDRHEDQTPWDVLADGLMPDSADADRRWLVHEALASAGVAGVTAPNGEPLDARTLRETLRGALERELRTGESALTRDVCARLAQFEVAAHELPVVGRESRADAKLGSQTRALELPEGEHLRPAIETVRAIETSLPERLGRDDDTELTSDLALGTAAHALTIALSVLRAEKLPLSRALYLLRAAVLPLSASVSLRGVQRLGAVLGFWAAAMFLTRRAVTYNEYGIAELGRIDLKLSLASLVALLVVLGVASAPVLRTWRAPWRAKLGPGLAVAGLAATSGLAAAVWAERKTDADWAQTLLAPGADQPPGWLLITVIALLGGPVLVRSKLRRRIERVLLDTRMLKALFGILVAVAIAVIADAASPLNQAREDGGWRATAALAALVGAPVASAAYLFRRGWP